MKFIISHHLHVLRIEKAGNDQVSLSHCSQ